MEVADLSNIYTMTEIVAKTGLSERTIRRYIKSGLLQADMSRQGRKTFTIIKRQELERFLREHNIPLPDNDGQDRRTVADKSTIPADNSGQDSNNDIKTLIREAIQEQQSAIMKPMEQQALFLAGKYQAENEFLRQQNETLRNELDAVKTLPMEDVTPIKEENEKLKKQLSILPAEPLEVNKILMQNADNLKALQEKLNLLPAEPEKVNEILKLGVEKFKALEDNFIKQSGEKEHLEEELKKLQQEAEEMRQKLSRPWWRLW